jgi:glycosyltransferase involved in cell wall biosynthesis
MENTCMARRLLIASQPLDAGVPRHVLDVVSRLDPARYEVDVVCPRRSALWRGLENRRGVRLHPLSPHRKPSPADLLSLVRLVRLARAADLIHAHSAKAGFLGRLAAAVAGKRGVCVFTPHAWSFWAGRAVSGPLYRALERRAAHWCRVIVALSSSEREAGLASGVGRPDQYRVVVNGIDLERFARPPEPVAGRIVALGRLAAQKRPDVAVRAMKDLRTQHPHARLHLAGDGPARGEVEDLVQRLGLGEVVRLEGMREDVPALLSQATCLLLTSDYESCPYTVIEAMAAGVPVVATRVGGVPELVEDGVSGLLVDPGSPEQVAAAIGRLLANPDFARELGDSGRRVAGERFSVERMVRETVALYDELERAA